MSDIENEIFSNENAGGGRADSSRLYKKETRIQGIRGDSGTDFLLPDYMGDVKRLLKYRADVGVANKFAGNGEVSFLLLVTYRVMYLDSEDNLTEAVFTSDYECSQKVSDSFIDADIESKVQNLTVRLQGPRKICAKACLISEMRMCEEESFGETPDLSDAQCKSKKIKIHSAEYLKFNEREYAEEIGKLDGISADEVEIIKCDAKLSLHSCHKSDTELVVTGDIDAFSLLRIGDDIIRVEKRLPFEESMALPVSNTPSFYTARGYVGSVCANVNNAVGDSADSGVYASVVMNFTVDCFAVCDNNCEKHVVCDAFVCGKKNECTYRNFIYSELAGVHNEKKKLSFTLKRDPTPIRNVIDYDASVKSMKFSINDSELTINGELEYNIIVNTMQPLECMSIKGEREFEEKTRLPWLNDKHKVRVSVVPCEFSPSFDNENLYVSMALLINICAEESKSEKILTHIESEAEDKNTGRRVIVYYPKEGDTLWSVAKKYSTPIFNIVKHNDIVDFSSDNQDQCVADAGKIIVVMN